METPRNATVTAFFSHYSAIIQSSIRNKVKKPQICLLARKSIELKLYMIQETLVSIIDHFFRSLVLQTII